MEAPEVRTYQRRDCVVFHKTKEEFGGLSNMASGFPLVVNGIPIRTSEALYQACRFPHLPDVQQTIIEEPNPLLAKRRAKPFRECSRQDWDDVRVPIMRWCLRVKLVEAWPAFADLLLATEERPIVEYSTRDDFWGAKPVDTETLVGGNVLGRLLMQLREQLREFRRTKVGQPHVVNPPRIPDFLLYGDPIEVVDTRRSPPTVAPRRPATGAARIA